MKLALETILRNITTPSTQLHDLSVSIQIDYKMILYSQYIAKRTLELAGRSLEIAFVYGGTKTQKDNRVNLKIDDIVIPTNQRIYPASFDAGSVQSPQIQNYFANSGKRLLAIGHSHADMDVFHSGADENNYKRVVGKIGIRLQHAIMSQSDAKYDYSNFSNRILGSLKKRLPLASKLLQSANAQYSYILPSLVFNAYGSQFDIKIASRTYYQRDNKQWDQFKLQDCEVKLYNKQATLSGDEKKSIDHKIRQVLSYNKIKIN